MKLLIRNCAFAIGGRRHTVEVIGNNDFHLPHNLPSLNLPINLIDHTLVVANKNELFIIGGLFWYGPYWHGYDPIKSNLVFQGTKWVNHSILMQPRYQHISICMPNGIYVFGGKEFNSKVELHIFCVFHLLHGVIANRLFIAKFNHFLTIVGLCTLEITKILLQNKNKFCFRFLHD